MFLLIMILTYDPSPFQPWKLNCVNLSEFRDIFNDKNSFQFASHDGGHFLLGISQRLLDFHKSS